MDKTFKLNFTTYADKWEGEYRHEVESVEDSPIQIYFIASDLCECPEDATLNRDLFNGWDYVRTLELGMKLAKMGYTDIEVINNVEEDE